MELEINDSSLDVLLSKLEMIKDAPKEISLVGATAILPSVHERIHIDGLKADGTAIGEYTIPYLRIRKKNNRGTDLKKILSLTRQMENDFTVVESGEKAGLGFNNEDNFNKASWQEAANKGTYDVSDPEGEILEQVVNQYLDDILS